MLTYGMHINQPNDPLQKVPIETIADKIRNPRPEFAGRIEQLRQVRMIDEKQYSRLKVQLPYFCCGQFNPPFRKKENFASISYFTLDFDHFSAENLSREETLEKLKTDQHLRLMFVSPGGDGIKAVFVLEEPCTDPGIYSHFYKAFAQTFTKKYGLEKVTDWVTHDVTRATFFSADTNAWDNFLASPVKITNYIHVEMDADFSRIEKDFAKTAKENNDGTLPKETLNNDTLNLIKRKLNPNYQPKREKNIFVPEQFNEAIPLITSALKKENIVVAAVASINYGRQLKIQMDKYWAELNVFYGQKGFSIVRTTKTGSNAELAELAYQIIDSLLN